jgi:polyhydroxybutyrate depolymerase
MQVEGVNRSFLVHFPSVYKTESDKTYPVVFMLHGGGGTGKKYYNISGWKELGEKEGFISVFPTAQEVCIIDRETGRPDKDRYWLNSSKAAALCEGQTPHDDVAFMRLIVEYLQAEFKVNPKRFYFTGFSNGMGFTLSRTVPELSDLFAAVGGAGSMLSEAISTPHPLPCLMMIGERDPKLIRHNGNQPFPTTIEGFEQNEFLVGIVGQMLQVLQLSFEFEAAEKKKHTSFFFTKTLDGGNQQLQFAILKGLAHVYPRGIAEHNNIMAAEVLWDFFKQYEKE